MSAFLLASAAVAFASNWVWEMAQMPAFEEISRKPWRETVLTCTWASVGDVAITGGVYLVVALFARNLRWGITARAGWYFVAAGLGFGAATLGEWWALRTGRWSYSARMPLFPGLQVGVLPLLQLSLLIPVSLLAGRLFARRSLRRNATASKRAANVP